MAISKRLRFELFKRDGFTCQYCGRKAPEVALELDHEFPRCEGGSDDPDNLTTACKDCNRGKAEHQISYDAILMDCIMRDSRASLDGPVTILETLVRGVFTNGFLLDDDDYELLERLRDRLVELQAQLRVDGFHDFVTNWRLRRQVQREAYGRTQ